MTAPTPPHASEDGELVYGKVFASYVQSVSDRDGDPDPYPDVTLLNGTAKFEAVFDGVSARGALTLPALPRAKGIVVSGDTYEIKNSNLLDKEGREGVWLVASVNEVPITWRITVTLVNERNQTVLNSPYIVTEDLWQVATDGALTINLPDLIPNPGALTPVEGSALRAAQKTLDEIRVLKDLIDTAKLGADDSAASALTYRNEAEGFKTAAETARTGAQTARTGAETAKTAAETARTGAETARTGAETARTGAETARTGAETAKADIDVTHDHIEQDVTHADTHALAAGASAQTATDKALEASNSAGTATTKAGEAAQSAADALTYRNTAQGAATTATTKAGEADTSAGKALEYRDTTKGYRDEAEGFSLTLAQRVETGTKELGVTSDGKLYFLDQPVEEVPLTVDTTVGTRVFLGDTMIHGDTGLRAIASLLRPGWSQSQTLYIRRVGNIVYLTGYVHSDGTATSDLVFAIPPGFQAIGVKAVTAPATAGYPASMQLLELSAAGLKAYGRPLNTSGTLYIETSWITSSPWPTSLPGTAA